MISMLVQEAFAFDYFSILQIKLDKHLGVLDDYQFHRERLMRQCHNFTDIVVSREYRALLQANVACWELVDQAIHDQCKASEVDNANQVRYEAKRALQKRFWPDTRLTEVKSERPRSSLTKHKKSLR